MHARTLAAGSIAVVLLLNAPAQVHARFGSAGHGGGGGHGGSHSGGGHSGGGRGHTSSAPRGAYSGAGHYSRNSYGVWIPAPRYAWGYGPYMRPPPLVMISPPQREQMLATEDDSPRRLVSSLETGVTFAHDSTLISARVLAEGEYLGASLGYTGAFSPANDGSGGDYAVHLASAHLTYALLSGERGRLRAEFGAHVAFAPDVSLVAPGAGLSGTLGLGAGFGLDARIFGNAWPYTEVDASAGLLWANDAVAVLTGARALYLDDNGALGEANAGETSDFYWGPYAGIAFAL